MRKGVVVDLEENDQVDRRRHRKGRTHGRRPRAATSSSASPAITSAAPTTAPSSPCRAKTAKSRSTDVRRVIDASKIINLPVDRQIIHALPRYFTVDGQEGVSDPVGMAGGRLEVDTHIITGGATFVTNVLKCVHRAGLEAHSAGFRAAGQLRGDAAAGGEAGRRRAARHRRRHDGHRRVLARQRDLHGDHAGRRQRADQRHLARSQDDARQRPKRSRTAMGPASRQRPGGRDVHRAHARRA